MTGIKVVELFTHSLPGRVRIPHLLSHLNLSPPFSRPIPGRPRRAGEVQPGLPRHDRGLPRPPVLLPRHDRVEGPTGPPLHHQGADKGCSTKQAAHA